LGDKSGIPSSLEEDEEDEEIDPKPQVKIERREIINLIFCTF